MTPEQRIEQLEARLAAIEKSDRYTFQKTVQLSDGRALVVGRTTGTKIASEGGANGQKLGFFGVTPVTQQTGVAVSAAGIHAALVSLGLITA